jgi:hypothetical protein
MLTNSYIGVHVWLMTSRQTEPDLKLNDGLRIVNIRVENLVEEPDRRTLVGVLFGQVKIHGPLAFFVGSLFGAWVLMMVTFELNLVGRFLLCLGHFHVGVSQLENVLFLSPNR